MKLYRVLFVAFFILSMGTAIRSQTAAAFAGAKIAVVNSGTFYDEKAGITKLVSALKALDTEFKPRQDELLSLNTRLENIIKEVKQLEDKLNETRPAVPIDTNAVRNTLAAKTDEAQRLQVEMKRKQEDAKQAYERRSKLVIDPINNDIGKAIDAYAKTRGIDIILDASKLVDAGVILALSGSADVTEAFIKDYNAKNSSVPVK